MDIRKNIRITREMLDGNLNRMSVTGDLEELEDRYNFAKQYLETLYVDNVERIEESKKLKELMKND